MIPTTMKAGDVVYIFLDKEDAFANFRLTLKVKDSQYYISGSIDEIVSWQSDSYTPAQFEPYMDFSMKWDGCCHVHFGDKDESGNHDGYLHLCGAGDWDKHIRLMRELYIWAEAIIPMDKDISYELREAAA